MTTHNGFGINDDDLKAIYRSSAVAKAILDHFASRVRESKETTVDALLAALEKDGHSVPRNEVVRVLRRLAQLGAGQFVTGRRGKLSRLIWRGSLVSLGLAARGEHVTAGTARDREPKQDNRFETGTLKQPFPLRPDFTVMLELPRDISAAEASRLAKFIETLPFTG